MDDELKSRLSRLTYLEPQHIDDLVAIIAQERAKALRTDIPDSWKAHLLHLLKDNEEEGSYYGPKEQYWKRSERIKEWLQSQESGGTGMSEWEWKSV